MTKKDKRQKASDVFNEKEFFIGKKSSFEEAFPTIKTLKVKVTEDGRGINKYNRDKYYSADNAGEYINCSNTSCYNGGFQLGAILRSMVLSNETLRNEVGYCQGYEGSPKGKIKYDDCDNSFKIEINIVYKD